MSPKEYADGFIELFLAERRDLGFASAVTAWLLGCIAFVISTKELLPDTDTAQNPLIVLSQIVDGQKSDKFTLDQIHKLIDQAASADGSLESWQRHGLWIGVSLIIAVVLAMGYLSRRDRQIKEGGIPLIHHLAWRVIDEAEKSPPKTIEELAEKISSLTTKATANSEDRIKKFMQIRVNHQGTRETLAAHVLAFLPTYKAIVPTKIATHQEIASTPAIKEANTSTPTRKNREQSDQTTSH